MLCGTVKSMSDSEEILGIITAVTGILSYIAACIKAGHVIWYSNAWWDQALGKTKHTLVFNKSRVPLFIILLCTAFCINTLITSSVIGFSGESLSFAAINTVFVAFALTYWVLLKKAK